MQEDRAEPEVPGPPKTQNTHNPKLLRIRFEVGRGTLSPKVKLLTITIPASSREGSWDLTEKDSARLLRLLYLCSFLVLVLMGFLRLPKGSQGVLVAE